VSDDVVADRDAVDSFADGPHDSGCVAAADVKRLVLAGFPARRNDVDWATARPRRCCS
jgi:hypothetical protein